MSDPLNRGRGKSGAPTILQRPASEGRALHEKEEPKNRSKDRPLQRRDAGPAGTCALELGGLGGQEGTALPIPSEAFDGNAGAFYSDDIKCVHFAASAR
jgi:hypothetical protein